MIQNFSDKGTEDIFEGTTSKRALKTLPLEYHIKAFRQLDLLNRTREIENLLRPPGNKLEKLKGDLKNFHSIRITGQWRIIFRWVGSDAYDVSICDYH
jgi:toxin HigB-1